MVFIVGSFTIEVTDKHLAHWSYGDPVLIRTAFVENILVQICYFLCLRSSGDHREKLVRFAYVIGISISGGRQ